MKVEIAFEKPAPNFSAVFKINMKIYSCGGLHYGCIADLLSIDDSGRCVKLHSMNHKRHSISLSGLASRLIALGGVSNRGRLKYCEKYEVERNKWSELAPLNAARSSPGSILLPSKIAFCFCGSEGARKQLNSIEHLQTELEWRTLPLNDKIVETFHLAATQYGNKIVLFGGFSLASYNTYILSEEGKVEQDLSQDPLIPGAMCRGTYSV